MTANTAMQLGASALHTTFFRSPHIGTYVAHNICADRLLRTEPQVRLIGLLLISNHHCNHLISRAWVLSGGLLRKRSQGNSATIISGVIITTRPPMHQSSPFVIADVDPARNDDNEIMDEP